MKRAAAIAAVALLAGCGNGSGLSGPDQCLRTQLFQACLKALPQGPQQTKFNDWDEVVKACESTAYYQSIRLPEHIKPECRAQR